MWELDYKESWELKNWCFWTVVLEKTLESPLDSKEIKPVNPKGNQSWLFIGRTNAEAKGLTHLKRPWYWERLKAGEVDNRGWDRWMASPTQWIWVWSSFWRWWRTGKPGVLQSMGSQRVSHNWATEKQLQFRSIPVLNTHTHTHTHTHTRMYTNHSTDNLFLLYRSTQGSYNIAVIKTTDF